MPAPVYTDLTAELVKYPRLNGILGVFKSILTGQADRTNLKTVWFVAPNMQTVYLPLGVNPAYSALIVGSPVAGAFSNSKVVGVSIFASPHAGEVLSWTIQVRTLAASAFVATLTAGSTGAGVESRLWVPIAATAFNSATNYIRCTVTSSLGYFADSAFAYGVHVAGEIMGPLEL